MKRLLRPALALASAAGLAVALWAKRDAISAFDWTVSWPSLLAAVALLAVAPAVQALVFWTMLRLLGATGSLGEGLRVWMRGFLARYAPSGVLGYALRVRAAERLGADAATVWTASAYEQLVALLAGASACVAAFLLAGTRPPLVAAGVLVAAVLAAVALRPAWAEPLVRRLLARRGIQLPHLLRGRELAALVAVSLAGWVATGAGVWVLVHGLAPGKHADPAWLAAAFALAWVVGFVVPFLPAGLGLRDATLAALLAIPFGLAVATPLTLALRLAGTLGELVAAAAVEAAAALLRRREWDPGIPR